MHPRSPRILVVRRDNIGDLLCTTPLLHALRQRHPEAYLAVLASSYNCEVLEGNPDVDEMFIFPKRQPRGRGLLATLWQRWKLMRELRRRRFDDVILANGGWRYARQIRGRRMVGFRERDNPDDRQPDLIVPLADGPRLHEVEKLARFADTLGVPDALGPLRIFPAAQTQADFKHRLCALGFDPARPTVGIHISSRRPQQRWPIAAFSEFMHRLRAQQDLQFLVFWSPGAEDDPLHPGDDAKASELMTLCADLSVYPCATRQVRELIAAMDLCRQVVCSDGGAMHVAAALGKPILCFFGDSLVAEWRPWGVPHVLLQPASQKVPDISVTEAFQGFLQLQAVAAPSGQADTRPETGTSAACGRG
jgi:ADP-heptose:LPS heptosyltransferase